MDGDRTAVTAIDSAEQNPYNKKVTFIDCKGRSLKMEQKEMAKTRLIIYVLMAYGLTYLMGILMWYGSTKGYDLTVFPTAQMMYPAAGVIIGLFLAHKGEKILPAGFFITVLATTGVLIVLALLSVFLPVNDLNIAGMTMSVYNLIFQYILIIGSIVALVFLAVAGNEKRAAAGLTRQNWKSAVLIVLAFVGIYIVRTVVSVAVQGVSDGSGMQYVKEWAAMFKNPMMWLNIAALPINYFFVFIAFFGEEYGWRYYLQPVLQKRFGLRAGVIILGVVWGLWHIPDDLFYYTQTSGIQMIFAQQITCISLGIFFAYAYMKTQNIWVPVCLHYLNNNLIPIISGTFSADVLENQTVSWKDLPVALVLNGLCFGFFLLADVFKKKEVQEEE